MGETIVLNVKGICSGVAVTVDEVKDEVEVLIVDEVVVFFLSYETQTSSLILDVTCDNDVFWFGVENI